MEDLSGSIVRGSQQQNQVKQGAPNKKLTDNQTRLQEIAAKIYTAQPLEKEDREFLHSLSCQKVNLKDNIGAYSSIRKIDKITKNIQNPNKSFEKTEKKFIEITQKNFSNLAEQKALAELIIAYDQTLNKSPFFTRYLK